MPPSSGRAAAYVHRQANVRKLRQREHRKQLHLPGVQTGGVQERGHVSPPPAPAAQCYQPQAGAHKKANYPPIVLDCLPNWPVHFTAIRNKLGHAPNARPLGKHRAEELKR